MITDDQAAIELLRRREARRSLAKFSEFINPDEPPALHHRVICKALDDVVNGVIRRLMIFCPPGAAKSTYSSKRFPGYYLGRLPKNNIITSSYDSDLAKSFGREVRNTLETKEYGLLFDTRLSEDAKAKGEWTTNDGGTYYACGVGSAVTGRRADLGLIDDPVKGQKEADSELIRNDTWKWYKSDFFSRLKPNAAQVIIQTRWSEDDLSGRILPNDWNGESGDFEGFDGQIWRVICLPAEARENDILGREPGEWLWPNYYTPEVWQEIKKVQTSTDTRAWTALYQQIPQPESGVFFKREWFKRFNLGEEPDLTLYGCSDYAVSDNTGDFTEHGVGGFDSAENLWFKDWWSGQVTPDVWMEAQFALDRIHSPSFWCAEVGVIRRSTEPFLAKAKREGIGSEKPRYFMTEWLPHIGDKAANARAFQALASMGKVYIPYTEWGNDLVDQLVKFIPNTNFKDDKVDVCGLFGRVLNRTFGPRLTVVEPEQQRDSYGFDETDSSWKTG